MKLAAAPLAGERPTQSVEWKLAITITPADVELSTRAWRPILVALSMLLSNEQST